MKKWFASGAPGGVDAVCVFHFLNPGCTYLRKEDLAADMWDECTQKTRLHQAACNGWCSAIKWLIQHDADVNTFCNATPLHMAASNGQCAAAAILLYAGARTEARDERLRQRTHRGQRHVVLRGRGDGVRPRRGTPLNAAAFFNKSKMCKLLLSRGARLDAVDVHAGVAEYHEFPWLEPHTRYNVEAYNFLAAVRAAGGWDAHVAQPRAALLAFRRNLPRLRRRGPSSVRAHERLFVEVPEDVFTHVLAFWRSYRDSEY